MTPTWWRRGWLGRWLGGRDRSPNSAAALLEQHADVVRQTVSALARLNELTDEEIRELAAAVDTHLAENDFEAIRRFRGQSSFANYLRVVVGLHALEYREELWSAWRQQAAVLGLTEAAAALESLVYDWATSPDKALATVATTSDPKPDRAALETLWAARPWRGSRAVADIRWQQAPSGPARPGAREPTPLERQVAAAIRELTPEERILLQARFDLGLTVEALAAWHRRPPDELAHDIETLLEKLRLRLVTAGFAVGEIRPLLANFRPKLGKEGEFGRTSPSIQSGMPDDSSNGD